MSRSTVPISSPVAIIDYTNWRGERRARRIIPQRIYFGANQWHAEQQWLLVAHDSDVGEVREFAMKDIHSWQSTP